MKKLQLTKGKTTLIDEADLSLLSMYSWHYSGPGYPATRVRNKIYYMHQIILGDTPKGLQCDHINRDKLDNRRSNLRFVTPQQNILNRNVKAKGVCLNKTEGKYKAYYDHITLGKNLRRKWLGTFATEQEAIGARAAYVLTLALETI